LQLLSSKLSMHTSNRSAAEQQQRQQLQLQRQWPHWRSAAAAFAITMAAGSRLITSSYRGGFSGSTRCIVMQALPSVLTPHQVWAAPWSLCQAWA